MNSDNQNPSLSGSGLDTPPATTEQKIKNDMSKVATQAEKDFDSIKHEAKVQLSDVRHRAEQQVHEAAEQAKGFAGKQKDLAADQLDGVASALSRVADDLQTDQSTISGYTGDLANTVRSVSNSLRSSDVDQIMHNINDFGRRQPLAFLGAAMLAGFAASRFMMSSAENRQNTSSGMSSTGDTYAREGVGDSYGNGASPSSNRPLPGSNPSPYSTNPTIGGH